MKKILAVLILSLVGFTNVFACESIFDHIDGITCELQYYFCSESNQDIKVCSKIKDKVKQVKKDIKEIDKKIDKIKSDYKKAEELEKKAPELAEAKTRLEIDLYKTANLIANQAKLYAERSEIYEAFIGTEGLQLCNSEKFISDVADILQANE